MSQETAFDCPKCGKQGLVRLHSDEAIFECVYCHYVDDLHKPAGGNAWLFASALAILLLLAVFGL